MSNTPTIKTKVYAGPSLISEHPVVALTIPATLDSPIPASVVDTLLGPTLAGKFVRPQSGSSACSKVTCAIAQALLAAIEIPELKVSISKDAEHQPVIIARYYDPLL